MRFLYLPAYLKARQHSPHLTMKLITWRNRYKLRYPHLKILKKFNRIVFTGEKKCRTDALGVREASFYYTSASQKKSCHLILDSHFYKTWLIKISGIICIIQLI